MHEGTKLNFFGEAGLLEVINLLTIGLTSFNTRATIYSDISPGHFCSPKDNVHSQKYMNSNWQFRACVRS